MGLLSTIGSASGRAFGFTRSAIAAATDAFFNRVTLLLPGDGTNGAQNNTFLDSSSNNFTITRNGNTTQGTFSPFSQTGWSGYFDGASDYIQYTNSDFSVSTGDFTAEWWMFITSDKSQVGIMTASTNSNLTIGYGSGTANARQPYVEWGGTGAYIGTMSNYMNTWVHICVMRSSGTVYTFQNGTLLSSASKSAAVGSTANMVIGTNAGDIAGQGVPGYLSNVRFAKAAIYSTSGFTVPTSPLTRTSQSATNVQFLTLQSNSFLDSNGVNTPASSPLAITRNGDTSIQAFSPFAPTAAYSAATNGGSGYFDGSGDYLAVPNNTVFNQTADFSEDCWVYFTGNTANGNYQYFASADGNPYFQIGVTGSGYFVFAKGYFPDLISSNGQAGVAKQGQWYHVAITRQGSTCRLFVNGVLQGTATDSSSTTISTGSFYLGGLSTFYPFIGYMSNFRFVRGGVPSLFSTSSTTAGATIFTPPTAPYTGSESLTAGSVSLLTKFTNAGITDATAKNVLETVGNAQISTTQSKFGGSSMYFDGTGDYLKLPDNAMFSLSGGNYTIEFWLYLNSVTGIQVLVERFTAPSGPGYTLYMNGTAVELYGSALVFSSGTLSTGQWYHIAVSRSGSTTYLFINGTQSTSTTNNIGDSAQPVYVGARTGTGSYLNGYIDDLRITKGYARYTANFTPPTAAFPVQ